MTGDGIRRLLAQCGADVSHFTSISKSARTGDLTTAISAGEIPFLQSGHGQARAARYYMHLPNPARLFDTSRAFGL